MLYVLIAFSMVYLTFVILNKKRSNLADPEDESCKDTDHVWTKWKSSPMGMYQQRECKRCGIQVIKS